MEFLAYNNGTPTNYAEHSGRNDLYSSKDNKSSNESIISCDGIRKCLSQLAKTTDGLTFIKLNMAKRSLKDLAFIQKFVHLRHVELNGNQIRSADELQALPHLVFVNLDDNLLENLDIGKQNFLQHLSACRNKLTYVGEQFHHSNLQRLLLNGNFIDSLEALDPSCLGQLTELQLSGNQLLNVRPIAGLLQLQKLDLSKNNIESIPDLSALKVLEILNFKENIIKILDGFSENNKNLQTLNLRNNNIEHLKEISKLQVLPCLKKLFIKENSVQELANFRMDALIAMKQLEEIDGEEIDEEEKLEADNLRMERQEIINIELNQ